MSYSKERIDYLLIKFIEDNCTDIERLELMNIICAPENEDLIKNLIQQNLNDGAYLPLAAETSFSAVRADEIFREILKRKNEDTVVVQLNSNSRKRWLWMAAAAVIVMILAGGLFFNLTDPDSKKVVEHGTQQPLKDINPPSVSKAVITLSNGQRIMLDSANSGLLTVQGQTSLVKLSDGQFAYNGNSDGEIQYNTLFVPRGGSIISIKLSDGTKVWLNSESSIKYPVAFGPKERKVEITGEAYFEVVHNETSPFIVSNGDMNVTVLGTHFNVNTYRDEKDIKVSLLEGAVEVKKGTAKGVLRPGQQASISSGITVNDKINMDEVIAWKEGKFQFGEANSITSIMKQIERWYDVDVLYLGNVEGKVGGTISRNLPVSQVLKMLEMTGVFEFQIVGKKVFVKQK